MPFVKRDGIQIHYESIGSADLPVLVLSHSLGANLGMWKPQISALSRHSRLLLYDMRGHGKSSVAPEACTIADMGRDVLHLLDRLEIEHASFCGLSMGGTIGQWLGIHASGRIRRLVLANTAAKIGTDDGWNTRIATVLRDGMAPIVPGTLERWFTADFRAAQPEVVKEIEIMLRSMDTNGYAASCSAIRDADFRATASAIRLPTLLIAGTHDPATTPEDAQFLAGNIPGSQYVELPTAHLSNVEAAEPFNTAVLDFLNADLG